ncbi:cbb3-type cytochrome c oxidase subunit 3 [Terrihabitans sp. B22-R8]|uniref:cbb3-type cytochrome c oxidase subunit 3 n=1 Tax=Terrihabitans sp. B22-R8 TaxID=3425128 RepID=UPI00403CBF2B
MADTYNALAHFAQTWGLVLFCVGFAGVVIYALSPSRKGMFDRAARIPLDEDDYTDAARRPANKDK